MKTKAILIVIVIVLIGLMCFASWKIWRIESEYQSGEDAYDAVEELVELPTKKPEADTKTLEDIPDATLPESDTTAWPVVDFEALQEINPAIVGWIYIEDTEINYPIVQGDDNSYYLKHLFTGEWNSAGCIFLDSRNTDDFTDRNNVVYGHHMRNETMFSNLDYYKTQEFYDTHPAALLLTPEQNYKLEFFAGYVASVEDDAWQLGFTAMDFEDWLSVRIEQSCFSSELVPAVTDHVVTLSTCSYEFENARFVIHGIIRE